MAVYVHCASHCLNLVLNSSSQVPPIRDMFTALSNIINFFNDSPKRRELLGVNLLTFCETRFIQRHDAILRFCDNFESALSALLDITESADTDSKTKTTALSLINAVSSPSFLVSLAAAKKVMSLTVTLSRRLQSPKLDLSDGAEMVAGKRLQKWRLDDRTWLGGEYSVFAQAEIFADIAGVHLAKPRTAGRQLH